MVDRPEHFLACPAHHYFAGEGVDLLDLELGQTLAYSRRRGRGPPVPLLVLDAARRKRTRPVRLPGRPRRPTSTLEGA